MDEVRKGKKGTTKGMEEVVLRDLFLGRHDIFAVGLGLVGDNAGAYVHDELGPVMQAAVMARNEHGRVVPGRVDELHIVGRFLAPMARAEGRGVCRGREASRAVPVKVPYNRGALLGFFRPRGPADGGT